MAKEYTNFSKKLITVFSLQTFTQQTGKKQFNENFQAIVLKFLPK